MVARILMITKLHLVHGATECYIIIVVISLCAELPEKIITHSAPALFPGSLFVAVQGGG